VNFEQVQKLLDEIHKAHGVDRFVVMGSLSVLGLAPSRKIPEGMFVSNELDGYPELDPDGRLEIAKRFGQGSAFELEHGYYFDPLSPSLPTLPHGWQDRLLEVRLPSGVQVKFLEPNDAAVSKYARGEQKDRQWIREGLAASILSAATIEYRFQSTPFLDQAEHERAKSALADDLAWIKGRGGKRNPFGPNR